MSDYHSLLTRQLKRYVGGSDDLPVSLRKLFAAVSDAYGDFDSSRQILERAIKLSSVELFHANSELRGVLRALPDLLFRVDQAGRVFELTEQMPGRPLLPVRSIGIDLPNAGEASVDVQFWLAAREVRASCTPVSFEYSEQTPTHKGRESNVRYFEVRLVPFIDDNLIGIARDITERKRAEIALRISEETARIAQAELMEAKKDLEAEREKLQHLVARDSLTGIWNRRGIFGILSTELVRSKRERRPLAVTMADLDFFKTVNDDYGHPAGDVVLQETACRIESLIRASDQLGRYGGEEFIVVMPECDLDHAAARIEQVRRAIEREPIRLPGGDLNITCSFGVTWTRDAVYDVHELVHEADVALYRAKQTGRNRVVAGPLEQAAAA